ncbi:MAG: hypothetical protein EBX39_06035 [Actinobacteria bacterium]|nr:hypothetical protein [Actinomycetota bacterium]
MSDTTNPSPRLQEFQSEVDSLKVTGGKANPERTWVIIGALLMIAGIVLTIISYASISGSAPAAGKVAGFTADFAALGTLGLTLAVVGAALFIVMSLRRYFRFWLIRLIFEQREQADRIAGR